MGWDLAHRDWAELDGQEGVVGMLGDMFRVGHDGKRGDLARGWVVGMFDMRLCLGGTRWSYGAWIWVDRMETWVNGKCWAGRSY